MSEVRVAMPDVANNKQDRRGAIFNDDWNGAMFNGYTGPNSILPDWAQGACLSGFMGNPPCDSKSPTFNASRSYHPGGINALMADGSVIFFKDSISLTVWRSLASTHGGEVVSADAY